MICRTFQPGRLHGTALVPPAKSEAHRALLLAALGQGPCLLHGFPPPLCEDVQAMMAGITALGAQVRQEGDVLRVDPAPAAAPGGPSVTFHVHACAAALRMLIPVFWVRGQAVRITMEAGLFARPLDALLPLAAQAGVTLQATPGQKGQPACVELQGKMHAGAYQVDGSLSSQFASGLLIALAHATGEDGRRAPSALTVTPPLVSRPYLDMTLALMKRFGAPFQEGPEGIFVLPPAGRKNPGDVHISGDWSQGAVLFCANALGSGVVVQNLREDNTGEPTLQGDARVLSLLRQMGLSVFGDREEMYVACPSRAGLMPLVADCTDIPDLAPILALTCTQAHGQSRLSGVKRLQVKETDRLQATVELLAQMGVSAQVSQDQDVLTVQGPVPVRGGFTADARGDHRMVMLLAIAALIADGPITVHGVEALDKSWPGFLETYQALGGMVL